MEITGREDSAHRPMGLLEAVVGSIKAEPSRAPHITMETRASGMYHSSSGPVPSRRTQGQGTLAWLYEYINSCTMHGVRAGSQDT